MIGTLHSIVFVALISTTLILTGCVGGSLSSVPTTQGAAIGTTLKFPQKALSDVECPFLKTSETRAGWETFDIQCEGWDRRTGVGWRGEATGSVANWEVEFLTNTDIASSIENGADCGEPETTSILNNQTAFMRRCSIYNGGFPYLFIVTRVGDQAFGGWGPVHLAPIFEAFVSASLQGIESVSQLGSESELIAFAEQQIRASGSLINLKDIGQFQQLEQLSTLHNSAKNHARALEIAQRALEILEQIRGREDPELVYLIGRIGLELSRLRPLEAEAFFQRGEKLAERSPNSAHLPEFLVYRAWHELRNGSAEQAMAYAQQSLELSRAVATRYREGNVSPRIAHSLVGVADLFVESGDLEQAIPVYQQALEIFDQVRGRTYHWVGESQRRLAELYARRNNFSAARSNAVAAVELKRALFGVEGRALAEALATQARVEQSAGQFDTSLALWRQVVDIVDDKTNTEITIRVEDIAGYIHLLFDLAERDPARRSERLAQAFDASQLVNTAAAGRAITQMTARMMNDDPMVRDTARTLQDAQKTFQDAQYALGLEQAKPFEERIPGKLERLTEERQQATAQMQTLEERLQNQFLGYGSLVAPKRLSVADVSAQLKRGEALLRILPGDEESWVFLIKSDGSIQGHAAGLNAGQITDMVRQLRQGVEVTSTELPVFNMNLSYQLYQQLLGPLDGVLNDVEHLIVVPSGALLSLPTGLLLRRPSVDGDYRDAAWLLRDMALSLMPSVAAVSQLRQNLRPSAARQPFIGFGDPDFSGRSASRGAALRNITQECKDQNGMVDLELIRNLGELQETADELNALARSLGASSASVRLTDQAEVRDVLAENLQDYRVIAFATHALLPGEVDCLPQPALAMTPPASPSPQNDGLLDASEIANLKLDADWVLLSACNTAGPGGELGGESLSGLATAFFYAGARALLVSHWAVFSDPTVTLTTGTLRRFTSTPNAGRAEALRQTQLQMLADANTSHPIFWAPFTLVGSNASL